MPRASSATVQLAWGIRRLGQRLVSRPHLRTSTARWSRQQNAGARGTSDHPSTLVYCRSGHFERVRTAPSIVGNDGTPTQAVLHALYQPFLCAESVTLWNRVDTAAAHFHLLVIAARMLRLRTAKNACANSLMHPGMKPSNRLHKVLEDVQKTCLGSRRRPEGLRSTRGPVDQHLSCSWTKRPTALNRNPQNAPRPA